MFSRVTDENKYCILKVNMDGEFTVIVKDKGITGNRYILALLNRRPPTSTSKNPLSWRDITQARILKLTDDEKTVIEWVNDLLPLYIEYCIETARLHEQSHPIFMFCNEKLSLFGGKYE